MTAFTSAGSLLTLAVSDEVRREVQAGPDQAGCSEWFGDPGPRHGLPYTPRAPADENSIDLQEQAASVSWWRGLDLNQRRR